MFEGMMLFEGCCRGFFGSTEVELLERFPTAKFVFIEFHVDAFASKLYSLDAEAKALFGCGFAS
jgi:hypothetical protein